MSYCQLPSRNFARIRLRPHLLPVTTISRLKRYSSGNHANYKPSQSSQSSIMLIMGAPGSGKGTLSQRISSEFNIMTLSSGDLLREHIRQGTDIGKSVKKQMEKGGLVSDDVIIGMILQEVEIAREKQQSVLLDGFPRTVSQAQTLTNYLSSTSPLSLVLNLDVPVSVILSRILDRWVHPGSGRVYNTKYSPPKVEGIDDITGEKLVRRSDDTEETIRTRLQQYQTSISPLLEYYQNQGIVHTFQGETSDQIYPQIQKVLINRLPKQSNS